jgi:hypothetical protein
VKILYGVMRGTHELKKYGNTLKVNLTIRS